MQYQKNTPWHRLDAQTVLTRLNVTSEGLSESEADERLARFGRNSLGAAQTKRPLSILIDQFRDFMIAILIAAAVISGFIGEPTDTLIIMVIVVLNAVIGFVQEYRSERAMEALRDLSAPRAVIRRENKMAAIDGGDLVPGDIVMVEAGAIVPADLRIIEAVGLMVDESMLTGESVPAEKTAAIITDEEAALADRLNLAYSGTIVAAGHATGVVVATGADSQLGQIAELVGAEEIKTPLQKRLARFGRTLSLAILAIVAIVFVAGVVRGEDPSLMLLVAISLAVAAIPEALPAVVTISLALGAQKLAKEAALIRKLPAVETLGSVTFICSDKTGTLTKNEMTVTELFFDGRLLRGQPGQDPPAPPLILAGMSSCNNAAVREGEAGRPEVTGEPTEAALAVFAFKAGGPSVLSRLAEIPFDSDRKRMTTVHKLPDDFPAGQRDRNYRYISFTKGAFEVLLPRVTGVWTGDSLAGFGDANRRALEEAAETMAADGLRVLALACRFWEEPPPTDEAVLENELVVLGLIGIMDPLREEVVEAVRVSGKAGITTVMITGDHPATAGRIGQDLGITGPGGRIVTGPELQMMNMAEFEAVVEDVRIYARVAPEHKIKIVKALQGRGELVAMTGDGVNDAPALKAADIGVAMGVTGTDVAKEASDLVLLDDNFATIVRAVAGGRRIYDNIRRFIKYTLTSNSAEILVMFMAPFVGLPLPLLPVHILWINLVTDGLPGLALAVEPGETGLMERPPRPPKESVFAKGLWQHMVWVGILMAGVSLFSQAWFLRKYGDEGAWQTAIFTVLALSQMGHALAIRSEKESLFKQGLLSNSFLLLAVLLTFVLQLAIVYTPVLQDAFKVRPLALPDLAFVMLLSAIVFIGVELEKTVKRRRLRRIAESST